MNPTPDPTPERPVPAEPAPPTAEVAEPAPEEPPAPPPGHLKVYLGYTRHTGKTWRLLDEARRRKARGQDVVVGWVRPKDLPELGEALKGLEQVPLREVAGQPALDLEAILRRRPEVCIVDELAHDNPPGSPNSQRWEDVRDLLAAGIHVVTAINIQYIEGLRDRVGQVLGRAPAVTVPDEFVRGAHEIMLVDATAGSVQGRSQKSGDTPLSERDLLKLRELALLFTADAVEEDVQDYKHEHQIQTVWDTHERILVCLTANPRGAHLVERARRLAARWNGELFAIYVTPDEKWSNLSPEERDRVRGFLDLARSSGAQVEVVQDADATRGILAFARQHDVTQICLGHAAAYPYRGALSGTVAGRILHQAAGMDVHLLSDAGAPSRQSTETQASSLPFLARLLAPAPPPESRGHLRVYLSYAPGSGKSWQMLQDGRYLLSEGQEVVVGFCDPHGRQDVAEQLEAFELVPPRPAEEGRPASMDLEAVVARKPRFCLVDGLACPTRDGRTRWQEIEALRDAGVHVFTTVDVSEVEGLKDTVERITGVRVQSTVPDWIVDEADELIFVDVAVRALLNRVKRGAVFQGVEVPEAMQPLFTEGSLNALRELAMRLVADQVQDDREALEKPEKPDEPAETLLVAIHQRPTAGCAIRRARRTAERIGAECYAVYVAPDEDWTGISTQDRATIEQHLDLARTLHLETHVLHGSHVARTLADFAVRHRVTRFFLGRSFKTGWREFFQRSVVEQVIRLCPWADIIIVADRA